MFGKDREKVKKSFIFATKWLKLTRLTILNTQTQTDSGDLLHSSTISLSPLFFNQCEWALKVVLQKVRKRTSLFLGVDLLLRPVHTDGKRTKKNKEQSEEIKEKIWNIKGSFRFPVRFHLVWIGCTYIRAKATLLPICCIVSNQCVYTTAMCEWQRSKKKIAFAFAYSSI